MYLGFTVLHISLLILFVLASKVSSVPLNFSDIFDSGFKDGGALKAIFNLKPSPTRVNPSNGDLDASDSNSFENDPFKTTKSYSGGNGFTTFPTTVYSSIDELLNATPSSKGIGDHLKNFWNKIKPPWNNPPSSTQPPIYLHPDPPSFEADDDHRDWPMRSITVVGSVLAVSLLVGLCVLTAKSIRSFAPLDLTAMAANAREPNSQTQMTTSLTDSQANTPDIQEPSAPPISVNGSNSRPEFNRVNSLPSYTDVVFNSDAPKLNAVPEEPPPSYSSLGYPT